MPMHFNIKDKLYNKENAVDGKGACTDLQIAGTFDSEHEFSLDFGCVFI